MILLTTEGIAALGTGIAGNAVAAPAESAAPTPEATSALGALPAGLPTALPLWLGAVALGALLGTQLGLHWLPVRGLRRALGVVLLIAAGKLLFA